MQKFTISRLEKADIHKLGLLINSFDFNDYKRYGVFKKEVVCEYILREILKLSSDDKQNWIIVTQDKDKIIGLISLAKISWAREVFGIEMAEIKHIITSAEYGNKKDIIKDPLSFIFQICDKEGISHLSCRISTDDYSAIHSLEEEGFRIMETLVTYLFNKRKHKVLQLKDMSKIRSFKNGDLESLIEMVRGAFPLSRFYLDPKIPNEYVDKFYIKWVKECCKGSLADKVLVAERKGEIIGFLSYRINKELEKLTGYKIGCQGLSTVSKRGVGVYPALVKKSIQDFVQLYDFAEFDTQINNYEVIKIWQRFGFDFVRSKYSFHKWLGK